MVKPNKLHSAETAVGIVETIGGQLRLRLWTDLPGLSPILQLDCVCGGRFNRLRKRLGEVDADWACPKCSRRIRLREAE